MKQLQATARYLCYKLNEMEGEDIIPADLIEGKFYNFMHLDDEDKPDKKNLIPSGYESKILDIAFDSSEGHLMYMNKGLSDSFVKRYRKTASSATQDNIDSYFKEIRYISKDEFCTKTRQHERAKKYLKEVDRKRKEKEEPATPPKIRLEDLLTEKISVYEEDLTDEGAFTLINSEDARDRIFRSIAYRRGQSEFRKMLLANYDDTCPVTGTKCSIVLEAAHILPYNGEKTNTPSNGMPLRSDIHVLFDLKLLTINDDYSINLAAELKDSDYAVLDGKMLSLPRDPNVWPNKNLLKNHREKTL